MNFHDIPNCKIHVSHRGVLIPVHYEANCYHEVNLYDVLVNINHAGRDISSRFNSVEVADLSSALATQLNSNPTGQVGTNTLVIKDHQRGYIKQHLRWIFDHAISVFRERSPQGQRESLMYLYVMYKYVSLLLRSLESDGICRVVGKRRVPSDLSDKRLFNAICATLSNEEDQRALRSRWDSMRSHARLDTQSDNEKIVRLLAAIPIMPGSENRMVYRTGKVDSTILSALSALHTEVVRRTENFFPNELIPCLIGRIKQVSVQMKLPGLDHLAELIEPSTMLPWYPYHDTEEMVSYLRLAYEARNPILKDIALNKAKQLCKELLPCVQISLDKKEEYKTNKTMAIVENIGIALKRVHSEMSPIITTDSNE